MVDDRAEDPAQVIRDLLADGPIVAGEFRKLARAHGVTTRQFSKACKAAGAVCVRDGPIGKEGWQWMLTGSIKDRHIGTVKGRKGYYSDNLFRHGKEIRVKLGDDIETARKAVKKLEKEIAEQREFEQRPRPAFQKRVPVKLSEQLRDLARQMYKLCKSVQQLEKGTP